MTLCLKILCGVSENALHHLKTFHLLKAYQTLKIMEMYLRLVLDDLMHLCLLYLC